MSVPIYTVPDAVLIKNALKDSCQTRTLLIKNTSAASLRVAVSWPVTTQFRLRIDHSQQTVQSSPAHVALEVPAQGAAKVVVEFRLPEDASAGTNLHDCLVVAASSGHVVSLPLRAVAQQIDAAPGLALQATLAQLDFLPAQEELLSACRAFVQQLSQQWSTKLQLPPAPMAAGMGPQRTASSSGSSATGAVPVAIMATAASAASSRPASSSEQQQQQAPGAVQLQPVFPERPRSGAAGPAAAALAGSELPAAAAAAAASASAVVAAACEMKSPTPPASRNGSGRRPHHAMASGTAQHALPPETFSRAAHEHQDAEDDSAFEVQRVVVKRTVVVQGRTAVVAPAGSGSHSKPGSAGKDSRGSTGGGELTQAAAGAGAASAATAACTYSGGGTSSRGSSQGGYGPGDQGAAGNSGGEAPLRAAFLIGGRYYNARGQEITPHGPGMDEMLRMTHTITDCGERRSRSRPHSSDSASSSSAIAFGAGGSRTSLAPLKHNAYPDSSSPRLQRPNSGGTSNAGLLQPANPGAFGSQPQQQADAMRDAALAAAMRELGLSSLPVPSRAIQRPLSATAQPQPQVVSTALARKPSGPLPASTASAAPAYASTADRGALAAAAAANQQRAMRAATVAAQPTGGPAPAHKRLSSSGSSNPALSALAADSPVKRGVAAQGAAAANGMSSRHAHTSSWGNSGSESESEGRVSGGRLSGQPSYQAPSVGMSSSNIARVGSAAAVGPPPSPPRPLQRLNSREGRAASPLLAPLPQRPNTLRRSTATMAAAAASILGDDGAEGLADADLQADFEQKLQQSIASSSTGMFSGSLAPMPRAVRAGSAGSSRPPAANSAAARAGGGSTAAAPNGRGGGSSDSSRAKGSAPSARAAAAADSAYDEDGMDDFEAQLVRQIEGSIESNGSSKQPNGGGKAGSGPRPAARGQASAVAGPGSSSRAGAARAPATGRGHGNR